MHDMDTDTLIAIVSSLLPSEPPRSQQDILDALSRSDGDPTRAVESLLEVQAVVSESMKRKRTVLDDWLKPRPSKKQEHGVEQPEASSSTTHAIATPTVKARQKPTVNLMSVLRQPPSPKKVSLYQPPPLLLPTPEMVEKHTPCTLHLSVLPPELACNLFYRMVDLSEGWQKNKWWLFDRVVESPHLTSFYARKTDGTDDDDTWQEAAQFWYNGRPTVPPSVFPEEMEAACKIVEEIVCKQMKKRQPYPLEWGGRHEGDPLWRANVAASNCYRGTKESVGFHSDQLTYLGPYPTIASLSLGTTRIFSLREVIPIAEKETRKARTYNIPLPHNSLTIMHASCQERFKHSIPPQPVIDLFRPAFPKPDDSAIEPTNCRINITFRFYRPDFRPSTIPKCHCGVPTILRPDMKNRQNDLIDRYWWTCYAGAQNDGKGCNFWKVLDMQEEGRGPCGVAD